jgi:hypothetical protein
VWFDKWELQPGGHLLKHINEGLKNSRKPVVVWTCAEAFSQKHTDLLAQDRRVILIVLEELEDSDIPPTLRSLLTIDFRNPDDYDLQLWQLIESLDLPCPAVFALLEESELREHEVDAFARGRLAHKKGKRFEDEVAMLYRLLGFDVKQDTQIDGIQINLQTVQVFGGLPVQAIVACKDKRIIAEERDQILARCLKPPALPAPPIRRS